MVVGKVISSHSNNPLFQDSILSLEAVALSKIVGKTILFIETVPLSLCKLIVAKVPPFVVGFIKSIDKDDWVTPTKTCDSK